MGSGESVAELVGLAEPGTGEGPDAVADGAMLAAVVGALLLVAEAVLAVGAGVVSTDDVDVDVQPATRPAKATRAMPRRAGRVVTPSAYVDRSHHPRQGAARVRRGVVSGPRQWALREVLVSGLWS